MGGHQSQKSDEELWLVLSDCQQHSHCLQPKLEMLGCLYACQTLLIVYPKETNMITNTQRYSRTFQSNSNKVPLPVAGPRG